MIQRNENRNGLTKFQLFKFPPKRELVSACRTKSANNTKFRSHRSQLSHRHSSTRLHVLCSATCFHAGSGIWDDVPGVSARRARSCGNPRRRWILIFALAASRTKPKRTPLEFVMNSAVAVEGRRGSTGWSSRESGEKVSLKRTF